MHISIAAETIFTFYSVEVSNAMLSAVIVIWLLIIGIVLFSFRINYKSPSNFQILLEMAITYLGDMVYQLLGKHRGDKILGFLFTFLILILMSNWFGLLPIVPTLTMQKEHEVVATEDSHAEEEVSEPAEITIGSCFKDRDCYLTIHGVQRFTESVHVLRAPTTDLSMTISLAVLAVLATNLAGFKALKMGYLKKFFNFSNPILGFVGLLELLSEFIKIISFSFRLFGNIFAGELLLVILTSLTYGIGTIPFMFLETFVGFIQAFVFFILTAIFISLAVHPHEEH